jgi:transposase
MDSHEVIKHACDKHGTKQIASHLGVSLSLVYKWAQPMKGKGGGSRNPLDRVTELINSTKDPRIIEWICEQAGGYFVRNPESKGGDDYEVMPATSQIVEQFAALLAEISKAAHDDTIDAIESERIRKVWDALKSFTEGFVNCCEDGDFKEMPNH